MASAFNLCLNIRTFAAWLGCILLAEILGSVSLRSSLTTIERRFFLSSTTTAFLSSCFQIGSIPVIILVSYFGSRYHRPRSIAIGVLLISLGFLLTALPQFLGDRYEFVDISFSDNTSASSENQPIVCKKFSTNETDSTCKEEEIEAADQLYIFIAVGMIISGIGSTPLQPLGISYVDDHASKHNAALLIGIVTSIGLAAPALGYLLGAFSLKLWVDIGWIDVDEIQIAPNDPKWVGAWWMGLLIASVIVLCVGIPMWFFPKELKKEEEDPTREEQSFIASEKTPPSVKESGNLINAFKRLLSNPKYLLIVSITTFEAFRISGLSVFSIKYYEIMFGMSASTGSFLLGAINLPALVIGTFMGSFAVKRWKLGTKGIAKLAIFSLISSLLVSVPVVFIGCETIPTAGLNAPYPGSHSSEYTLSNSCNKNCNCVENIYAPVCGPGEITFISPCHAGCIDFVMDENNKKNYTQCSCVAEDYQFYSVSVGRCHNSLCEDLTWVVVALKTIASWCAGLHVTPLLVLMMRSLQKDDKAFGIGIATFTFRLLAFIPGPLIFGYLIDQACLHWTHKPCSDRRYCSVFDSLHYRNAFLGLSAAAQVCSSTTGLIYYFKYARWEKDETENKLPVSSTPSSIEKQDEIEFFNNKANLLNGNSEVAKETVI